MVIREIELFYECLTCLVFNEAYFSFGLVVRVCWEFTLELLLLVIRSNLGFRHLKVGFTTGDLSSDYVGR